MWPFSKKKRNDLFCFKPKQDITAEECVQIVESMTPYKFMSGDYVKSLPKPMRRHFVALQVPGNE